MITIDEFKNKLSRISLEEKKAEKLAYDMNSIFEFIEKLNELKTENVEPVSYTHLTLPTTLLV